MSVCPDCNAELRIVEVQPHVHVAQVFHDDTCPMLRAMERVR